MRTRCVDVSIFPSSWSSQHLLSVGCGGNPIRALSQHGKVLRGSAGSCLGASASNERCKMQGLLFAHSGWWAPVDPLHSATSTSFIPVPNLPSPGNTLSKPDLEHYPWYPYLSSSLWHLMIVSASQLQYLKWCVCSLFLTTAAIPLNPLSVAVVGVVAEAQSKSCSFDYTQSVLSIISNQPLISSCYGGNAPAYTAVKRSRWWEQTKRRTQWWEAAEWELSTPIPGHKLRNNVVKYSWHAMGTESCLLWCAEQTLHPRLGEEKLRSKQVKNNVDMKL